MSVLDIRDGDALLRKVRYADFADMIKNFVEEFRALGAHFLPHRGCR